MIDPATPVRFVVRRPGEWILTSVPVQAPRSIDLGELLQLAEGCDVAADPNSAATFEVGRTLDSGAVGSETIAAPAWTIVGRLIADGLEIESNDQRVLRLEAEDLRVLDAVDGRASVATIIARTGVDDAAERLVRMLAGGHVRLLDAGHETEGGKHSATHAPDPTEAPTAGPGHAPTSPSPTGSLMGRIAATIGSRRRHSIEERADDRVPVYAIWHSDVGPLLSLGMLTAAARHWAGGILNERFEIRRPELPESFFEDLATRSGPAVLLCSDYVWSLEQNLELAHRARELCPDLIVIHGGPSAPKYPDDARRFLRDHAEVSHVLVRGEGEHVLCKLLEALTPTLPNLDTDRLATVEGITFIDPASGDVVRTPDQERIRELDTLPSPYLTGEYDHIHPDAWVLSMSIETNRGCPYGCTFCDWGSATLSRIRKFDLERVTAELQWAADRNMLGVQICDANFGIMSRDVEIAQRLADIRRRTRAPRVLSFTPAKNTTKHLAKIFDEVTSVGFLVSTAISLQTTDPTTLAAVERSNISTESYLALAADLRRRGLHLQGDLLIGLPGQTYESYKADIQFFLDHEIAPRSWSLRSLPNAPMNDPAYRERYRITTDDDQIVLSTSTITPQDRQRMIALRKVQVIADQFCVLSQVMRVLQWEYAIASTTLLETILDVTTTTPGKFPLITWVFEYFDLFPTAAVGWHGFYGEIAQLLSEHFGLDTDREDLVCVLELQEFLMPAPERSFPASIELTHDYLSYYRAATASLYTNGHATGPPEGLANYPAATFTIESDPLGLCTNGLDFHGDSRDESMLGLFWIGIGGTYELLSGLVRVAPEFRDLEIAARVLDKETARQ